jgi:hypothetical protein
MRLAFFVVTYLFSAAFSYGQYKAFKDTVSVMDELTISQVKSYDWYGYYSTKLILNDTLVTQIKQCQLPQWQVMVVMGNWCSDSREFVAEFLKIAESVGWDEKRIKLVGVNRKKKSSVIETSDWHITNVPTFIFIKSGKEIARITETPEETLLKDMYRILCSDK